MERRFWWKKQQHPVAIYTTGMALRSISRNPHLFFQKKPRIIKKGWRSLNRTGSVVTSHHFQDPYRTSSRGKKMIGLDSKTENRDPAEQKNNITQKWEVDRLSISVLVLVYSCLCLLNQLGWSLVWSFLWFYWVWFTKLCAEHGLCFWLFSLLLQSHPLHGVMCYTYSSLMRKGSTLLVLLWLLVFDIDSRRFSFVWLMFPVVQAIYRIRQGLMFYVFCKPWNDEMLRMNITSMPWFITQKVVAKTGASVFKGWGTDPDINMWEHYGLDNG